MTFAALPPNTLPSITLAGLRYTPCKGPVTQAASSASLCMCPCNLISHVLMCAWGGPVPQCAFVLRGSAQKAAL